MLPHTSDRIELRDDFLVGKGAYGEGRVAMGGDPVVVVIDRKRLTAARRI